MLIGRVDLGREVLVVAEIGNNHEGHLPVARELVKRASETGAQAVKLQTFKAERFQSPLDEARLTRLRSFELPYEAHAELAELARSLGLLFLSTPFDLESARFLIPLVDALKIASGDNTFVPLIELAARSDRPLIISAGLATIDEIEGTVRLIEGIRGGARTRESLAVLHCVSAYPVDPREANLLSVPFLAQRLGLTVGYSDHTLGIDAALTAVALGARLVEKHFTLDKTKPGFRDHQLSADPADLRELVVRIKLVSELLGTSGKPVQPGESSGRIAYRRSISAARALVAGHRVASEDLDWLRPGGGIAPGDEARVVGHALTRDVPAGHAFAPADLE
ncbi:MAG: N-acetylneuraminate synthase family protein [Chloroflexi bacterium]|nr:N-acetylneuraminate synthase family protein [Chloroflexota bacterium]